MVVSHLPAGCHVDASASRPLVSASAAISAYQCPATSCPLVHFLPFSSVCWLVIASPIVAPPPPCIAFCRTAASRVHPRPPLFVRAGWLLHHIFLPVFASRRAAGSRAASYGTFVYIRQLALSRTAIFVAPSLGAAAIAGILKCTVHSPSSGIANGHCSLSYGSRPPTRPPSPPHCHLYSSTIHHPCPTLVISWRKVMTWRLFMFV